MLLMKVYGGARRTMAGEVPRKALGGGGCSLRGAVAISSVAVSMGGNK